MFHNGHSSLKLPHKYCFTVLKIQWVLHKTFGVYVLQKEEQVLHASRSDPSAFYQRCGSLGKE